jgi:tetratricopeptide (TPR) repeat protein
MEEDRLLEPADKEEMKQAVFTRLLQKVRPVLLLSFVFLATASCSIPKIIILHDPLSPEEHINLGLAYEKKGETRSAIAEYKTASKELPEAYLYLGNICYSKGAYAESEKYYREAIRKKPDLSDAYNNLAWLLYIRRMDFGEALALARKAVELKPSNEQYADTLRQIEEASKRQEAP